MKNKLFFIVLLITVCVVISSCISFQASGLQMGLDQSQSTYEDLGDFRTRLWVNKFIGTSGGTTFLNLSSDATDGVIRNAIENQIKKKGGDAAINIRIRYGNGPLTYILNVITATAWAPSTVTVSGTVVRKR
jgi:hypothetical protein